MEKKEDFVLNGVRPVSGATVTVYKEDGNKATLYADNGTTPQANPLKTDALGQFGFYAANGKYRMTITGGGIKPSTIDFLLYDPTDESGSSQASVDRWRAVTAIQEVGTVVTVPAYLRGRNALSVWKNGVKSYAWSEATNTSIMFTSSLAVGDVIEVEYLNVPATLVSNTVTQPTTVDPAPTPTPTPTPTPSNSPDATKILGLGDSTQYGADATGAQVANPAPAVMDSALTGYTVTNLGVSGNSMKKCWLGQDGVNPSFSQLLAANNHKYITINNAINDTYSSTPSESASYFGQIVDAAHAAGRVIILITPNETDDNTVDTVRNALLAVASSKNVPVIDVWTYVHNYRISNGLTIYQMCPNGYHPSQAAYTLIGNYEATQFTSIVGGSGNTVPTPSTSGLRPYILDSSKDALFGQISFRDEFNGPLNTSVWKTGYYNPDYAIKNYDTYSYASGGVTRTVARIWPVRDASLDAGANTVTPNGFFRRELVTAGNFSQLYGYFEAEIKLPTGRGTFPAWWLFNDGNKNEIDIMEAFGGGASPWSDASLHPTDFSMTTWQNPDNQIATKKAGEITGQYPRLDNAFNKFGVHWTSTNITYYLNGAPMLSHAHTTHRSPLFLLLDLWFGSAAGNPNVTDTPQGSSNSLEVEYVRVWPLA